MFLTAQPLDPIAFEIGPLTIFWYGILIGLGAFLGYLLTNREMKKRGLPADMLADLLMFALPAAIIGARIYYVIFRWEQFADNPISAFAIWEGGLAIHGALIASVITGLIFAKVRKVSFWKLADITAPGILLGQAIGRWGNFMNQEVYGGEVPRSFLENMMLPNFIIEQMFINGAYHHPTFLYESVWNILGVALLLYLRRWNLRRGELFITYFIYYSIGRLVIEGIRTDYLLLFGVLRTAQVLSITLIIAGIILIIYRRKKGLADKRYLDN
ncbi:prolipoprotein diacylglyceryl transferase [Alkalicoccus halolimnae]|uniref:Phosphatidylglycerol--prolipoprotein diacylglyceryl transferase n=1 Tax=Alkalicoccus halolimnae TaxID=1667239 RepID=A0A5C7F606_9BACI|nr:prolipoprotein diacylglyceryl transferase [Alkalicoccus halolimnae]TXF84332.1 prolipoprotein diacylglyceryl transferase [Alkalicoccus halolimnae]